MAGQSPEVWLGQYWRKGPMQSSELRLTELSHCAG
jgi:hypothetical protein